ncbi:MAG: tRNA (N(6)-L-threonylcarbamoyladenosine(37)-C(2))-methylthiotransferase MtaB [Synergistaceae bacterium]|jgi:threonylcarbamoyladenosine tRNA methylthiotransferase MtaB|nr:tRNA (N(6)-L-threonylcarbamoyladenosine(37)-C(2))-methylthiotransferase MtaB [Synergistaceae bacterium]
MSECRSLAGKTFSITVLGCRVNHYEAEAIASMLESSGAVFAPLCARSANPDIIVAVTCSITSAADATTRKALRRARRENPQSLLVACGCWAQAATEEEAISLGVDILIGNRVKGLIPEMIERWHESPGKFACKKIDVAKSPEWDRMSLDRPRMLTRAFIKVQDGCDRGCSYCAVPSLRGAHVSRSPDDVAEEISSVASHGTREIILTGIQLGSYEYCGTTLAGLIRRASRIEGVRRLRLGSLEPFSLTEELLRAAAESEAFCRHLHLPVQSGDDGVLASMRRGYSSSDFARIVGMARDCLGDETHISTDLIVGFPGEGEEAFSNSMRLLEDLSVGKVHVFPFSPRRGTEAASMGAEVPRRVVKERVERALRLSGELAAAYASKWIGKTDSILVENADSGTASGWSRHYVKVYAAAQDTGNCLKGNELQVNPKISIGSILLCEGVDVGKVTVCDDE